MSPFDTDRDRRQRKRHRWPQLLGVVFFAALGVLAALAALEIVRM